MFLSKIFLALMKTTINFSADLYNEILPFSVDLFSFFKVKSNLNKQTMFFLEKSLKIGYKILKYSNLCYKNSNL